MPNLATDEVQQVVLILPGSRSASKALFSWLHPCSFPTTSS
jgi:hypothetical protein